MEIVLSIILLIFGVLQIILFFKVWSMTNNVKKITKEMVFPRYKGSYISEAYSEFLYYIYNNEKDKAREFVQRQMWGEKSMTYMAGTRRTDIFDQSLQELKEKYGYWYELLGEEFPTYSHMRERLKK